MLLPHDEERLVKPLPGRLEREYGMHCRSHRSLDANHDEVGLATSDN